MLSTDASGDWLRRWLGMDRDDFYDERRVTHSADGFLLSGLRRQGSDLAAECPRRGDRLFECYDVVMTGVRQPAHRYQAVSADRCPNSALSFLVAAANRPGMAQFRQWRV